MQNMIQAARMKGSIDHCAKEGRVSLAVTLRKDVASDTSKRNTALEGLAGYGSVTGDYEWDPTNIALSCETPSAKRLVDDFYANGKLDYVAKVFVDSGSVVPCYRR